MHSLAPSVLYSSRPFSVSVFLPFCPSRFISSLDQLEKGRALTSLLHGFSLLLKHTLSLPVLSVLFSLLPSISPLALPFRRLHHPSSIRLGRTCHVLTFSFTAALFLSSVVSSHPRDDPIFSSCGSYHEQSLTSASNATCRRTFFTDSCLLSVCMRGHVYLY